MNLLKLVSRWISSYWGEVYWDDATIAAKVGVVCAIAMLVDQPVSIWLFAGVSVVAMWALMHGMAVFNTITSCLFHSNRTTKMLGDYCRGLAFKRYRRANRITVWIIAFLVGFCLSLVVFDSIGFLSTNDSALLLQMIFMVAVLTALLMWSDFACYWFINTNNETWWVKPLSVGTVALGHMLLVRLDVVEPWAKGVLSF